MMRTEERIRAVMRVLDQGEDLGEALAELLAELGDILAATEEKIADEAYLSTALGRLGSAKDSATEALALLRQWLKEAEGL
jgi:hypothetical protein